MPVDKICKCCGQTLPPPVVFDVHLSAGERDIFDNVHKAGRYGIETDRLMDRLYGDQENGGPLTGVRSLHVRIVMLNRKLKPEGYRIGGTRNGRSYGRYFLNRLEPADAR